MFIGIVFGAFAFLKNSRKNVKWLTCFQGVIFVIFTWKRIFYS
jgi:hypothetical protein